MRRVVLFAVALAPALVGCDSGTPNPNNNPDLATAANDLADPSGDLATPPDLANPIPPITGKVVDRWREIRLEVVQSFWIGADEIEDALLRVGKSDQRAVGAEGLDHPPLIGAGVLKLIQDNVRIHRRDERSNLI